MYLGILNEPHFEGNKHEVVAVIEFTEHFKQIYTC